MRKTVTKLVSLLLAATLVLGGCGSKTTTGQESTVAGTEATTGSSTTGGTDATTAAPKTESDVEPIKDLVTYQTLANELQTFNVLNSQSQQDTDVLTNCVEGLLFADNRGKLIPALAETWGTEDDGLTWTFHLRKDVKWVDVNGNEKADCTAQDFITGLEWILNYHKNQSANTSMPMELIKGAAEYYAYTKDLSKEEAYALDNTKFLEMVGIQAPDDYTLVYTCTSPKPYFDTVMIYNCMYPAPQALIDELGVDEFFACNNETMWYNGCYTITSYIQGNEKVFTKNPLYWDKDCTLFDTVTVKMLESADVAFQLYQSGEIDNVNLTESNLKTIYESESNPFHDQLVEKRPTKYSFQFHFNYDKHNSDGTLDTNWNTAVANDAFRLSWYYGLNLTEYYKRTNAINPLKCESNSYTMKGLVYTTDGTDYTTLVTDQLNLKPYDGQNMQRYDKEKGEAYKKQAMEELAAKGVTFPVGVDYYISASNQTALDTATVLKQVFSDCLGDDYVVLNIKTYVSSLAKEVRDPRLQSIAVTGWGADYGDPMNYLSQVTYGGDNAYLSTKYSNVNDATDEHLIQLYQEFTDMVTEADKINDDMDKRYKAFADAEVFMLENGFVVPLYFDIGWELTHINDYTKSNAMYGCQTNKYKNWETSKEAYTTEQYDAIAEAFESGK